MKRIKQIIEALKVLSRTPSKTIHFALTRVLADADSQDENDDAQASEEDRTLIVNIVMAVVAIAEDMEREKPAKGGGGEAAGEAKS